MRERHADTDCGDRGFTASKKLLILVFGGGVVADESQTRQHFYEEKCGPIKTQGFQYQTGTGLERFEMEGCTEAQQVDRCRENCNQSMAQIRSDAAGFTNFN